MADVKPMVITRTFDAPRTRVWAAWTEVERLKAWFSPMGFQTFAAKLDLRPGGTYHYGIRTPQGQEMWGLWTFREIKAPERLVLVNSFSDAAGGITRHPMAPTWPREMLSTTTFAEKDGKTTITLEWLPLNATPEELATFEAGRPGMQAGWNGTWEQFDAYLKKAG